MVKVLVIDDDSHFRGIIRRILLRSRTDSVDGAATEEEAEEALSKASYDLVLLDLFIEGRKSWDTLRRIRALQTPPAVIMISCEDLPANVEYAKTLGAADFLPKPVDFTRFKTAVAEALVWRQDAVSADRVEIPMPEDMEEGRPGLCALGKDGAEGEGRTFDLVVLADRRDRESTVLALSSPRFRLLEADDPVRAAEMIGRERPDAVVVRIGKDLSSSVRRLALLREEAPERVRLPVLAITDAEKEGILAALEAGADDYLTLPVDPRILAVKVEAHLRFRRERERSCEGGASGAMTGLQAESCMPIPFRARLEVEFKRSVRHKRYLSLALLRIGDRRRSGPSGPEGGENRILPEVSRLLRRVLRSSDVVARWGNRDLAVMLPETTAEGIYRRACGIRTQVEDRVSSLAGEAFPSVCRMGIASLSAESGRRHPPAAVKSSSDLLRMASHALDRAWLSDSGYVCIASGMR